MPINEPSHRLPQVVVLADHGSQEKSRVVLEAAVAELTGGPAISIDARDFLRGGRGRAAATAAGLTLWSDRLAPVTPDAIVVYEIHPDDRARFTEFQALLAASMVPCLGAGDAEAWRNATDKARTTACFEQAGIRYPATIVLRDPSSETAAAALHRLGGDAWARPVTGLGGRDVFHIDTDAALFEAMRLYATTRQDWLLSADAGNLDDHGRRHQLRVVVLGDQVLRVVEHIQDDPDAPCNEAKGARSYLRPTASLPVHLAQLACAATRSLGLPFGGVDLCTENAGLVFEVNVHPALDVVQGLETVAIPLVAAHLDTIG
ncbi:RimK family alpha-L-glutamate ligase, partial [Nocardia sp. NPDC101769]|uniref:ATP-grasp domain-containing protein n=1 Tax=Nocardia sp. NPDC101769 TaxID=3364333 RepID=UPI003819B12C